MRLLPLPLITAGLVLAGTAGAAEDGRFAAGVTAGTLGVGAEASYGLSPRFNLRGVVAGLDISEDLEPDDGSDLDYDGDLELRNAAALVDFHPFAGGFRLSGGAVINGNEIRASAECNRAGGCRFGDSSMAVLAEGDSARASVEYDSVAPYLGLGWGNAPRRAGRWGFTADLGVMHLGDPDVSVSVSSANPQAQQEAENEERELEDDAEDFELYPVLMVGATYRF